MAKGQTYNFPIVINDNGVKVIFEKEGIVECSDISSENNIITFKSESPGTTNVKIISDYGNVNVNVFVNKLGIILVNCDSASLKNEFNGFESITLSAMIILAALAAVTFSSYKKQLKKSIFSYKNILYIGSTIFAVFLFLYFMPFILTDLSSSRVFMILISNSSSIFTLISAPVILILSIAVSVSNISLICHEGFRPANALGIALSAVLLVGICILLLSFQDIQSLFSTDNETLYRKLSFIQNLIGIFCGTALCYFESLLLGTVICGIKAARHKPAYDKDYIIILGCGISKDGSLLPLLKGRVDRALDFYKKQKKETGKSAVFIPSGGQGPDEIISESEAMRNYLISNGISENEIIMENKSTTTYENMLFSKRIIDSINPESNTVFSTTNYHVFRSGILAASVGLNADGMGSRTKWYFWPNAFLREFIGVIVSKFKINIFILFIITIILTALYITFGIW